jgi:hypothetical protein
LIVLGLAVWIDPTAGLFTLPVSSNASGLCLLTIPVPSGPSWIGSTGYLQFGWNDPCAPGGVSGSCAMSVTIQ